MVTVSPSGPGPRKLFKGVTTELCCELRGKRKMFFRGLPGLLGIFGFVAGRESISDFEQRKRTEEGNGKGRCARAAATGCKRKATKIPSLCAFEGCNRKASLQATAAGVRKHVYYCCAAHLDGAGAMQTAKNKGQRSAVNLKTKGDVHIACMRPACNSRQRHFCNLRVSQVGTPSCHCVQNAHVNGTIMSASEEVSARPLRNVFSCEFALQESLLLRRQTRVGVLVCRGCANPSPLASPPYLDSGSSTAALAGLYLLLSNRHAENSVSANFVGGGTEGCWPAKLASVSLSLMAMLP